MHTLNRLKKYSILSLKDEIILQESKYLWRWEKKILPSSLFNIITERIDRLRGRRFNIGRNLKEGSISKRLTKRANLSINNIKVFKTKKSLANNLKISLLDQYQYNCTSRNCYICSTI